ncbi:MAG: DUF465 domain-containing protein [Burkholderiales bacterium]|nr:DUF465 domain-containing protein [Burkholderiales bacterium]
MHIEHHPLIVEFPEQRDAIHHLKTTNHHFAKLAREYEELDKAITRVENREENVGDLELEQLKKQRLALKDALHNLLTASA